MPLAERRCYPRRYTRGSIRAWMFTEGSGVQDCHVVELSRKGVSIKCARLLRPGSRVQLAFAYERAPNVTRLFRRWTRVARRTANGCALVFVDPAQKRR